MSRFRLAATTLFRCFKRSIHAPLKTAGARRDKHGLVGAQKAGAAFNQTALGRGQFAERLLPESGDKGLFNATDGEIAREVGDLGYGESILLSVSYRRAAAPWLHSSRSM